MNRQTRTTPPVIPDTTRAKVQDRIAENLHQQALKALEESQLGLTYETTEEIERTTGIPILNITNPDRRG